MSIEVVKYDKNWGKEFQKAKNCYENKLKNLDVEIIHVGSTSIKGLWAKPILDIDIIVNNEKDKLLAISILEDYGYKHLGNLGIKGREAFSYEKDNSNINWMEHHLYVCTRNCESLNNHILLKKHLLNNPLDRDKYSNLKKKLCIKYPNDIDSYVEGKTELITSFLKKEGMQNNIIEEIKTANKNPNSK